MSNYNPIEVCKPVEILKLREGDVDPTNNKKIKKLLCKSDTYIIYLDEDYGLEFYLNHEFDLDVIDKSGEVLNQISHLEAVSSHILFGKKLKAFRLHLAESLKRLITQNDLNGSEAAVKDSKELLDKFATEQAKMAIFYSSTFCTVLFLLAILLAGYAKNSIESNFSKAAFEIFVAGCFGSFGSLLSVIQRNQKLVINPESGLLFHVAEGISRTMIGVLGAVLFALAVKNNILLGGFNGSVNTVTFLCFIGFVSGASERLVPSLISQVEKGISINRSSR